MDAAALESLVLQNAAELSRLRSELGGLVEREHRVEPLIRSLRARVLSALKSFHRDRYKATDQRLQIAALADEIAVFDRLGYDIGVAGAVFLLGVAALLAGRTQAALDSFDAFIGRTEPTDPNFQDAHYLSGMVCYNRRDFRGAIAHFDAAFHASAGTLAVDWQSKIYVGELLFFLRAPAEQIDRVFRDVEDGLKTCDDTAATRGLRSTLYLKWGNCYVGALDLEPRERNAMVNTALAIDCYKRARAALPPSISPDSLLPVIVDYSLAQALLLASSIDMDLSMTPSELIAHVFHRLRRIVLSKREETILAQSYLMLGTAAVYSTHVSPEICEIYLEYARTQTLGVPSDVCFYSCITKELLARDEFVSQIDFYTERLQAQQALMRR